jgi:hypothetical protein
LTTYLQAAQVQTVPPPGQLWLAKKLPNSNPALRQPVSQLAAGALVQNRVGGLPDLKHWQQPSVEVAAQLPPTQVWPPEQA